MRLIRALSILAFAWCLLTEETVLADTHLQKLNISIVLDGPWENTTDVSGTFKKEISALLEAEYEVAFPREKQIRGDWSIASVRRALDDMLADDEVDLIIALGILGSGEVCRLGPLKKPVIAPYVLNPKLQGIPIKDGTSNTPNLSYLTLEVDIRRHIELFREIFSFQKLVILGSSVVYDANPDFFHSMLDVARESVSQVDFVPVAMDGQNVVPAITETTEAVYVCPLMGLPDEEFRRIVGVINQRKIPSFSMYGESEVRKGILLGLAKESSVEHLARQVGINVRRIFQGEMPSTFPVAFSLGERISLNMDTARQIGFSPSWDLMTEGLLIESEISTAKHRTSLSELTDELLRTALDIRIQNFATDKDRQNLSIAWSHLFPKVDVGATQVFVDPKDVMMGMNTERSVSGKLTLTQVIFSEQILTNIGVQRDLHKANKSHVDEVALDAVKNGLNTYLNVLRSKRLERIRQETLLLIRSHLETAKIRRRVGIGQSGEIHRWNGEIANARSQLIAALSTRHSAQIAFNRILARPLEDTFLTEEVSLEDPIFKKHLMSFLDATSTPKRLTLFCDFVVAQYLSSLPELRRLDAFIEVQERMVGSSFRSFWSPTIGVQGEVIRNFDRSGVGSEAPPIGGDVNWNLGFNVTFPVFNGGQRIAKVRQAKAGLAELKLQRENASRLLQQRIRTAVYRANNSGLAIGFASDAASASLQNLAIVRDAYARGVVSILSLLDAQNYLVIADESAGDAIYKFFLDMVEVERSMGKFLFGDTAASESFFKKVEGYVSKHR